MQVNVVFRQNQARNPNKNINDDNVGTNGAIIPENTIFVHKFSRIFTIQTYVNNWWYTSDSKANSIMGGMIAGRL